MVEYACDGDKFASVSCLYETVRISRAQILLAVGGKNLVDSSLSRIWKLPSSLLVFTMDSLWTEYEGERYHVLGIAITDPELVGRTKRVIRCCIGLLGVLIVRTIILLMINEPVGTTLLSLLFNVSIPAFGYLGARDGSSSLMCIFVALMILNAANAIAVLFMVGYACLTGLPQKRTDGTYQEFQMTPSMWIQVFLIFAWALMALIASFHANKLFNK